MIKQFIQACASVFFDKNRFKAKLRERYVGKTSFAAIDLELTSLQPSKTQITSLGYVEGKGMRVSLASSGYHVINTRADLGQSPVIHGLTQDILERGEELDEALRHLLPLLKRNILIFHNAKLDLMALDRAFKQNNLQTVEVIYIDTLQLALYQLNKQHQVLPNNSATLTVCRQRLDLPAFPAHNALDDALATLQLFFAQLNELGITGEDSLKALLHTKAVGQYQLG